MPERSRCPGRARHSVPYSGVEMADDWATTISLGVVSVNKARQHVPDTLNETDSHQRTFPPFHTHKACILSCQQHC